MDYGTFYAAAVWLLVPILLVLVLCGKLIAAHFMRIFNTPFQLLRGFQLHVSSEMVQNMLSPQSALQQDRMRDGQDARISWFGYNNSTKNSFVHSRSLLAVHRAGFHANPLRQLYGANEQRQSHLETITTPHPLVSPNSRAWPLMTHIRSPLGVRAPQASSRNIVCFISFVPSLSTYRAGSAI
jgi:hypothetical protein